MSYLLAVTLSSNPLSRGFETIPDSLTESDAGGRFSKSDVASYVASDVSSKVDLV